MLTVQALAVVYIGKAVDDYNTGQPITIPPPINFERMRVFKRDLAHVGVRVPHRINLL